MPHTVLPIGLLDTCGPEKDAIVLTGWVLDRILDSNKVERAYAKLVETWPILSARLRVNQKTKKWEYHLPHEFSPSCPQYVFKTVTILGSIHEKYKYPKPSNVITCTIKENPIDLYSQGGPRSVGDFLKRDTPMVQLQLTLFDDATLVGLTTPHVLCDGHGTEEIISALSRILNGQDLAPLQSGDPFAHLLMTDKKSLEMPPYWRIFDTWQTIRLMWNLLWDYAWNWETQNRELFFPQHEVERIKNEAMDDLKREHGEGGETWISTNDALVAFCLKCMRQPTTSKTPLNVSYAANVRLHLADAVPKPYLHNATCLVITPTLPLSAISTMSLGALAYHIRKALRTQTTPGAIKQHLSGRISNAGRIMLFFEPDGTYNLVTSWRQMKLMEVDFSGALPDGVEGKKVQCVYIWGHTLQPFPIRNFMMIVGDDPRGGVWIGGCFDKSVWERSDGFGQFIRN